MMLQQSKLTSFSAIMKIGFRVLTVRSVGVLKRYSSIPNRSTGGSEERSRRTTNNQPEPHAPRMMLSQKDTQLGTSTWWSDGGVKASRNHHKPPNKKCCKTFLLQSLLPEETITMLLRSLLTLTYLYSATAFAPSPVFRSTTALFSSTEETLDVPLVVEGKNIEVTEALMAHIEKRIGGPLKKLSSSGQVTECDVILSVSKNPKVRHSRRRRELLCFERHLSYGDHVGSFGTTFACTHASPDMYNSIDQAAHALQRKLVKYKERRQDGWHGGAAMAEDFLAALESFEPADVEDSVAAQEEFVDPEAPTITKVKSFDLEKGISVQEAIFALDYVDHDFYVFRNEETDKITVVYKRNGGGIGLVEP
eukprot:scaffold3069_cov215-Amphora_coffeaeformis.AAC.11